MAQLCGCPGQLGSLSTDRPERQQAERDPHDEANDLPGSLVPSGGKRHCDRLLAHSRVGPVADRMRGQAELPAPMLEFGHAPRYRPPCRVKVRW